MAKVLAIALLCVYSLPAVNGDFRVNETASKIVIRDNHAAVSLAFENGSGTAFPAKAILEWVNPSDKVLARTEQSITVGTGASESTVAFPFPENTAEDYLWARLRYRIRAVESEPQGLISVAQLAEHAFVLHLSAPGLAVPGASYQVEVRALNPVSGQAVPGVAISGHLDLDSGDGKPVLAATDQHGSAKLTFTVPMAEAEELDVKITGTVGDFSQEVTAEIKVAGAVPVLITTDKPIYQPGQALHVRALCFTGGRRGIAFKAATIRVRDPEDLAVFVSHPLTTRFGVASADWQIPPNTRLGDYKVLVEVDGMESSAAQQSIKLSRYELPNFSVSVKADRPFYMPKQNASVEVRADYLFGKPVVHSKVRVVRESGREWNFKLQKWEIDEEDSQEATTGLGGSATVMLDLAEASSDFVPDEYKKYEDLHYTAYITDSSSGRTEQRRFDLRITRDSIHVYLIPRKQQGYFVSTSRADGTPVSCKVSLKDGGSVTTSSYGLARIAIPPGQDHVELVAQDGKGGKGYAKERVWSSDTALRIVTDKTLYHPGESVKAGVTSDEPLPAVALEILREGKVLETRWLDLSQKSVKVAIPWSAEFAGEITIGISARGAEPRVDSKAILFPTDTALKLNVRIGQAEYRPGQEAAASFALQDWNGKAVEGVLGVSVVDSAVDERARTDREAGSRWSPWNWGWYHYGLEAIGGVTREDLLRLDPKKPFPDGLDLVAEAMLGGGMYAPHIEESTEYQQVLKTSFSRWFAKDMDPIRGALDQRYRNNYYHPHDLDTFRIALLANNVDFDSLRDPWGMPYRTEFRIAGSWDQLEIQSAGPDKIFGTADDLQAALFQRNYFEPIHEAIQTALKRLPAIPLNRDKVQAVLHDRGIDIDAVRDPWGTAYRMSIGFSNDQTVMTFVSAGPDRKFDTRDDIGVGTISGSYFAETRRTLARVAEHANKFPQNETEWNTLMTQSSSVVPNDPWGHPLYLVFSRSSTFSDLSRLYTEAKFGSAPVRKTLVIPVTQHLGSIVLRSAGPDGKRGTSDDFDLATFSRLMNTEESTEKTPEPRSVRGVRTAGTGAIIGMVKDPSGAVIPNATISAKPEDTKTELQYAARADKEGLYLMEGLPAGFYDLQIGSAGFQIFVMRHVPVRAGHRTVVDATLDVGSVSEKVEVSAAVQLIQTESAQVSQVRGSGPPRSTPRVREYFPETLLWQPSLETDSKGQAQLKFKLADSITTWKLAVFGSTADGEMGMASADIRAFQPFFVDHDPPRVLTQGDEINMPVTVRNYLDRVQKVDLVMKPEQWFKLLGSSRNITSVAAAGSVNVMFPIKAIASVVDGKNRVTATSTDDGDAIEKPVTVHPDGRLMFSAANAIVGNNTALELDLGEGLIPDSAQAELKVYPNVISHVVDSLEGILQRPYGCGEQTISSTYPNLLFLKMLKAAGREDHPLAGRARQFLRQGYERLLGYRAEGGFNYWGHGEAPNVTLTAYALRFLIDAKDFVKVPDELIADTRSWLGKQQAITGTWRVAGEAAYVALAMAGPNPDEAVRRAVDSLARRAGEIGDPYGLAAYSLAARRIGRIAEADAALERLRGLARADNSAAYWNLETNTPFYGWGLAGRLETTALVVRAVAGAGESRDRELLGRALAFLLRNKDHYGVWHSTQATVLVLDALIAAAPAVSGTSGPVQITVNGQEIAALPMPGAKEITGPVRLDLSRYVRAGKNQVTLSGNSTALVQLQASYYTPWPKQLAENGSLRLRTSFDKTAAKVAEPITCRVHAERVGFGGYGMILAEIGLPPGADVDRGSLDKETTVHRYDVLPDRIVFYLWPNAGGADFKFHFRPRFAMHAKSAGSTLYDYYNPEAQTFAPASEFVVR